MNFINQIFLFGLLAIAIPILIHLLNRRRHRTVKWAAMEFLLKATRESRGRKKLKHFLILAARALAIAGIIFAFTEPVTNRLGSKGLAPDTVILVLDRSPSMELITNEGTEGGGISKREIAIRNVQESLQDMPETRLVLIDSATTNFTEITSPSALTTLAETGQSDKSANISMLVNSALTRAVDPVEKYGNTEIWVASDLQQSNWNIKSKEWATVNALASENENLSLRFIALSETSTSNNLIRVNRSWREGNELVIELFITRTNGVGEEAISVTYALNGSQQSDEILITGSEKIIRKRIPLQKSVKKGYGYVSINPDSNLRDNVSYFVFGEKTAINTAIVSEGGEAKQHLEKAAALPSFRHLNAENYSPNEARKIDLETTALVIWQAPLPTGKVASDLEDYIKNGGLVLIFPPAEDSSQSFLGLSWGPKQMAGSDKFFEVASWNQNDGPFRDGIAGDSLPLDRIDTITRRTILGDAVSLASFADGELLATRKILGGGRAIFISTLPNLEWSQLEHTAIHLITIHRLFQMATEKMNTATATVVGSDHLKLRPRESRQKIDDFISAAPGNAEHVAGVWQLGQRTVASNRSSEEDQLELIEAAEIKTVLPDVNYTLLEERGNQKARSVLSFLWRYFLYAALAFLILEAVLTLPAKVKSKKTLTPVKS